MIQYRLGIEQVMSTCAKDSTQFDEFMQNPAEAFQKAGIPIEKQGGFNRYFNNLYETQDFSPILKHVRHQALSMVESASVRSLIGQIASYPIAEQIVRMSRNSPVTSSQSTELSEILAELTRKDPDEIIRFITSLQPVTKKGVDRVVAKLDSWCR
ncbi:MAG: hypothetical protein LH606_02750 [Cytophagaceae bacterium]|nr:hypothetical protein [Cytophagaceae bacterium]